MNDPRVHDPDSYLPCYTPILNQGSEYSLRLPAYRFSHARRYHPYPRYCSPRRYIDALGPTGDSINRHDHRVEIHDVQDLDTLHLHHALEPTQGENDRKFHRILSFSTLVVDLALRITRNFQRPPQTNQEDPAISTTQTILMDPNQG